MSDVTAAPAASPPPAPAPANETPINQNPVSAPQPIGSQAPDKPVGDIDGGKHRPQSRREAIQQAFNKSRGEDKPQPQAAKPRIGHNQPPEETEKLDLRKAPQREVHRDQGRFARAPDAGSTPAAQRQQQAAAQPRRPANPLPETAPYREPPQRMADHAKADWAAAPESVRGEVHRMEREAAGLHQRYRADAEVMDAIRPFHQLASQHGTTLQRALNNYVSMEQKLRADPIGGIDVIVNNLNLRTPEGQRITSRDIAYHILSQTPEQHHMLRTQNAQTAASHQIGALHQEVAGLKGELQQMHTAQQFVYTRSAVDQFADAHPRFDELGDLIEQELRYGFDLETAYRRSELLRPSTHAAQTRTPSAQTRSDRSIHGAPDTGLSDRQRPRDGKPIGRRQAIANAIKRVNGGV